MTFPLVRLAGFTPTHKASKAEWHEILTIQPMPLKLFSFKLFGKDGGL